MRSTKTLFLCGISHESSEARQIGQCAVAKELRAAREAAFMEAAGAGECVLLSTCNRVEYYFTAPANFDAASVAAKYFAGAEGGFYAKRGADAAAHLFEVASGLRSQMVGETEIFGQVKGAYAAAFAAGHCAGVLNAVFQKAAQVGKWVRTNTDIGRGKISIGSVGAELAAQIFTDITRAEILLVGSGEAGRLVADALFVRGAKRITVVSRSRANADSLAARVGAASDDMPAALANLRRFDIIVCATSAGVIITRKMLENALKTRRRPVFLIDLSVPKNIEDACADIDDVFLYDLQNLSQIAASNLALRRGEIDFARAYIAKKAAALAGRLF